MNQQIFKFLKAYSKDPPIVNRLIISSYIYINNLKIANNKLLKSLIISKNDGKEWLSLNTFLNLIQKYGNKFSIEDLIQLFEFVISPAEKEVNGAVYTPAYIREYIIDKTLEHHTNTPCETLLFGDISCGCGGFFYTLSKKLQEKFDISFEQIYRKHIVGIDIKEYSIERTAILLSLLAIQEGEDKESLDFNLYCENSLCFDFTNIPLIKKNGGFSAIIGNPPYVGSSKIDEENKKHLNNWCVTKTGKTDLYIPFFQVAIENLTKKGILGYITVNNFYRSLNGRALRNYFSTHQFGVKMIDFGSEQVFKGRSTYTCICFITRLENGHIQYVKSPSSQITEINNNNFINLQYNNLDDEKGWILQPKNISQNINVIEHTGTPLGKAFNIKNGFATLKNDVYLFTPNAETDNEYSFIKDEREYKIEKIICRDAIKPNILKNEASIELQTEKLIFPYSINENTLEIIEENIFRNEFPLAYAYLSNYSSELNKRDKEKRKYPAWYAFGRSQALTIHGYKLLFPYIADNAYFVLSKQRDLMFYNGYALVSDNLQDLQIIQKVLKSSLFWYYIKHTSKPYGSEYFALAKNYVKNFGVYNFNEDQKRFILECPNSQEIDTFLLNLYGIQIN